MKLTQFDPPANWNDFDANQRKAWSQFISWSLNFDIKGDPQAPNFAPVESYTGVGKSQFYNPMEVDTDEPMAQAHIAWNGFPQLLYGKHATKEDAWKAAEQLLPTGERPQDEYLEWHVIRDGNKIKRISFTCEGPEYWEALAHGYPLRYGGQRDPNITGNKDKLLELYRRHISPQVQMSDLFLPNGRYNRLNKWNTTHGAMHLNQRNNTLRAEMNIAAFATILRKKTPGGPLLTDADELIKCGAYGEPGRASDPLIGSEVNKLARDGYAITLQNPIGLYIDKLNTQGWTTPNGTSAQNFWKIERGAPGMILRAVYEVPATEGYTVSDIKIGGRKIEYGGQLAEKITVKLTGIACRKGSFNNAAHLCEGPSPAAAAPDLDLLPSRKNY